MVVVDRATIVKAKVVVAVQKPASEDAGGGETVALDAIDTIYLKHQVTRKK
jgi:hypothetical protein